MSILAACLLSLLGGVFLNLVATRVGGKLRCTVKPRLFGCSDRSITYLGGVAVAAASVSGFLLTSEPAGALAGLLIGALVFFLIGLVDDGLSFRNGINPLARLLMGAAVAFCVWFWVLRPVLDVPVWLDGLVVVIFLTGAANAFNLVDNMNGVAGFTAVAVAAGIASIGLLSNQIEVAALAAAVAGACLAFLPFNARKSSVYLGDSGALFIGFVLGGLALMLRPGGGPGMNFLVAVALMTVPFTDTLVRQVSRWAGGNSIFDIEGGTDHTSHRLVASGLFSTEAAAVHGMAALSTGAAAVITSVNGWAAPALIAIVGFSGLALFLSITKIRWTRGRALVRGSALLGLAGAASMLAAAGPAAAARSELKQAQEWMAKGAAAGKAMQAADARAAFGRAETLAAAAEGRLASPLVLPARLIPLAGNSLDTAHAIASGSVSMAKAAGEGAQAIASVLGTEGSKGSLLVDGQVSMGGWSSAEAHLKSAASLADSGLSEVQNSSRILIPPVAESRREFLKRADPAVRALQKGADAAGVLPDLLGAGEPRTWFLAVQNGAELRGTGGLIGAFGILKADNGRVTLERLDPDGMLPKLDRPVEDGDALNKHFDEYESRRLWLNVNMTADFPTAASLIAKMWEQGTGEHIDGVMAIDVPGLAAFMESSGRVDVPELGQSVNSGNVVQALLSDAYSKVPNRDERQGTLAAVGRRAFDTFLNGGHSSPGKMMSALAQAASEKHLMLWSRSEAKALERMGVSGALSRLSGADHLLVVAQNAQASKMDFYARRTIDYDVRIDDEGGVKGDLEVGIKNNAPASGISPYVMGRGRDGSNRSYVSVYRAPGSALVSARMNGSPSLVQSHMEKGFPVTSKVLDIPRGEVSTLKLSVAGHELKRPGEYRLALDRQPGLFAASVRVSIRLPKGAVVTSMTPGMRAEEETLTWTGKLRSDKELLVRYDSTALDRFRGAFGPRP